MIRANAGIFFKRGQVTLFIIIGLALLLSIGVFVYYSGIQEIPKIPSIIDKESVTQYVNSCLEATAQEVIATIAAQGGMYHPVSFRSWQGTNISYWCYGEGTSQCVNALFLKNDLADQIIFGIAAFLMPNYANRFSAAPTPNSCNQRGVIAKTAVAVNFKKIGNQMFDVIKRIRT